MLDGSPYPSTRIQLSKIAQLEAGRIRRIAVIYRRGVAVPFRRDEHPDRTLVEIAGIEPATSGLQSRRSPS